ncbi:MAG TPA: hypothetical protein VFD84_00965, partial [Candidatus Binatia bacterium]|nr:hypothetical protein [Candidatus Binatia bacterium]
MNRLCRVRAIAVLVAGSLLLAGPARASHFRFATLSWRPKPGGPANTVQFTVQEGWRRSAFIGTPSGGPPIVGDTIFADGELDFGDGSESVPIEILVTSVNEDQDWFSGTTQTPIEHTYPAPNDEGQPWLASVDSCCRIDSLQNNAGGSFHFETTVDLAAPPHAPNGSPITTELPIVGVPPNAVASFFVPAVDPDRDALTWRLSTSQEAAGVEELFVQPPDLAVAAETGKVSWNTTGHSCGQLPPGAPCLWSLAITIQDGSTKIPLDFIVSVTRNTIGH